MSTCAETGETFQERICNAPNCGLQCVVIYGKTPGRASFGKTFYMCPLPQGEAHGFMGYVGGPQYPYKPQDQGPISTANVQLQKPEVLASMAAQIQHVEDCVRTFGERLEYAIQLIEGGRQAPVLPAKRLVTEPVDMPKPHPNNRYY